MKPTKSKVRCIFAKTGFYKHSETYTVYTDGKDTYVRGSDGLYDKLGSTVSKFVEVRDEDKKTRGS